MKNWHKQFPPYEGKEPYLYFAFASADEKKVWKILRPLLERGCRVWYSFGPAGGADELLHDQERSSGAALTLLYLTDAACADKDTKSNVLVNQKYGRQILCLDPDGTDRRLRMGLREDVRHIPLYRLSGSGEIEVLLGGQSAGRLRIEGGVQQSRAISAPAGEYELELRFLRSDGLTLQKLTLY